MSPGETIVLNTPENPRLHETYATIESLTEWGAHVIAPAAATGRFRAAWSEMQSMSSHTSAAHRDGKSSPTGELCQQCGGINMVRSGACLTCQDCGTNTGCS